MRIINAREAHIDGILPLWREMLENQKSYRPDLEISENAEESFSEYLRELIQDEYSAVFVALEENREDDADDAGGQNASEEEPGEENTESTDQTDRTEHTDQSAAGSAESAPSNPPLGYIIGRITDYPDIIRLQRCGYISDLSVNSQWRRHGIGRSLVQRMFAWFTRNGIYRVELRVAHENEAAKAFWHSLGFSPHMDLMKRKL